MAKLLAVGDVGWDLLPHTKQLGGWAAKFAYYSHLLGHQVTLASSLGKDEAGRLLTQEIEHLGLSADHIQVDPEIATLITSISFDAAGTSAEHTAGRSACDFITRTSSLTAQALEAEVLYHNARGLRFSGTRTCVLGLLERMPDAFKVFDVRGVKTLSRNSQLQNHLRYSQLVHFSSTDTSPLCSLLGLPELDPPVLSLSLIERFQIDICLIVDPLIGAHITSKQGHDIYLPMERDLGKPLLGWHEAFLSGFVTSYLRDKNPNAGVNFGSTYAYSAIVPRPTPPQ